LGEEFQDKNSYLSFEDNFRGQGQILIFQMQLDDFSKEKNKIILHFSFK